MTLPAIFFGHGNPMNALASNEYTQGWARIGDNIGKPKAVLMISAHWFVPETAVTVMAQPRTIHDFGGFPPELYRVQYRAPGAPDLARQIQTLLSPLTVRLDEQWGLDHGAWSVLAHVYPYADVPVIQLSIDESKPPSFHYELGAQLSVLRDQGILIAASGNLVHNLHTYAWGRHPAQTYEWAARFEDRARALIELGDHDPLINYEGLGRDAQLSVPTPEHYLPLLYVLGAQRPGDAISFPVEGVDGGSISMLAVKVG